MISRNLRHLRVLLAVADEASITGAAERFKVSQPAVTQMLRKIEEQAGGPLFDRTSRGFVLNERGAVLADISEGGLTLTQWMEKAERRAVKRHLRSSKLKAMVRREKETG